MHERPNEQRPPDQQPPQEDAPNEDTGIYGFVEDDPPAHPPRPKGTLPAADAREYKSLIARDIEAALNAGELKCPDCNYNIKGLGVDVRCPECGRKITTTTIRQALKRANTKRSDSPWFAPTICLLIGLALSLAVYAFDDGLPGVIFAVVYLAVTCIIGWAIFFFASIVAIGFNQSIPITMLQLCGAYSLATGISDLLGLIPIPILPWLISVCVLIGLLMKLVDLEQNEAILIAFFTWVAKVLLVAIIVASMLGGL